MSQQHISPQQPAEPPPSHGVLPGWVLGMHELELAPLLGRLADVLPPALGYRQLRIYVFDAELDTLQLVKTNVAQPVPLSVAGDAPDPLAAAVRDREVIRDGVDQLAFAGLGVGECILPLFVEEQTIGCIHLLDPDGPPVECDLTVLADYLARLLAHARRFERVRAEACQDALTGLFNYRWMCESIGQEIRRAQRYVTPLSLLLIDLDGLKKTNDVFGHHAGDQLLQHAGRRIQSCLRQVDSAARIGGDEFVVLLPGTSGPGAVLVAERILEALEQDPPVQKQAGLYSGASIGATVWQAGWDAKRLMAAADQAMYQAKQSGGSAVAGDFDRPVRPGIRNASGFRAESRKLRR